MLRCTGAPDDKRGDARAFRRELKTARRCQRQAVQFTNHPSKAAVTQALFHRREDFRILPGLAEDHAVRMQTDAREGRSEEIAAMQAPKNRPVETRENTGREQHGSRRVVAARTAFADFVDGTKREAATRERRVNLWNAESQRALLALRRDTLDHAAELRE